MTSKTVGLVLHSAARYDLLVWLVTFGRERAFRSRTLGLARLEPGEAVLDVGCGTGTLAIAAKQRVGPTGAVHGIDPSAEMIARARKKAEDAAVDVAFVKAAVQALPFPDARFDVALSTIMLHHLPRAAREQCAREIRRVLRPGGRALVVDFAVSSDGRPGLLKHFVRHRHVDLPDIVALLGGAGLGVIESGPVGLLDTHFALAMVPA